MFQAQSLGLGSQWGDIKKAYSEANYLCGDIVKVTPSSKVVGDLAQFMVSNKLTKEDVIEQVGSLSFPKSVIEYFQGHLGVPPFGYLEPFRTELLKSRNLKPIVGRPGLAVPPANFAAIKSELMEKYGPGVTDTDVMSYVMYPKVFEEYKAFISHYGG